MAKSNKPETFTKLKASYIAFAIFSLCVVFLFSIVLIYADMILVRIIAIYFVVMYTMLFTFNTMKLYSMKKACEDFKKFIMEVLGGKEKH